jgi:hypothetical protein
MDERRAVLGSKIEQRLKLFLQEGEEALREYPEDHPAAIFLRAYLSRWRAVGRGEADERMAEELEDLGKLLSDTGLLEKGPEAGKFNRGIIGDDLFEAQFSYQETMQILKHKSKGGRPLANTSMKALLMKVREGKKLREIVEALCDPGAKDHVHDEGCFDRFEKQIEYLEKKVEKYAASPSSE